MNRLLKLILFGASLLFLGVILLSTGCGTSSKTRIRVMNASPDEANLDVLVDGKAVATNLAYETDTGYLSVSSGSRHLQIEPSGTTTPIIDQMITVNSGTDTTILAANFSSRIAPVVLADDNSVPSSGNIKLRLVNAAPSLGSFTGTLAADVYVNAPGTDINSVGPTISTLAFEAASGYQSLTATNYEVIFTNAGLKSIVIDSGSLAFSAGQIRTFVGLNSQSGGFTYAMLSDVN